jgi:hypothetical protein
VHDSRREAQIGLNKHFTTTCFCRTNNTHVSQQINVPRFGCLLNCSAYNLGLLREPWQSIAVSLIVGVEPTDVVGGCFIKPAPERREHLLNHCGILSLLSVMWPNHWARCHKSGGLSVLMVLECVVFRML